MYIRNFNLKENKFAEIAMLENLIMIFAIWINMFLLSYYTGYKKRLQVFYIIQVIIIIYILMEYFIYKAFDPKTYLYLHKIVGLLIHTITVFSHYSIQ